MEQSVSVGETSLTLYIHRHHSLLFNISFEPTETLLLSTYYPQSNGVQCWTSGDGAQPLFGCSTT